MVKLILECEKCGNKAELVSNQRGHQVQMSRLIHQNFRVETPELEKNGELEDYDDIDDVEVELKEVRINCKNCGDYIVLESF